MKPTELRIFFDRSKGFGFQSTTILLNICFRFRSAEKLTVTIPWLKCNICLLVCFSDLTNIITYIEVAYYFPYCVDTDAFKYLFIVIKYHKITSKQFKNDLPEIFSLFFFHFYMTIVLIICKLFFFVLLL